MNFFFKTVLPALMLVIGVSCQQDTVIDQIPSEGTVLLQLASPSAKASTPVVGSDDENGISSVEIYVFNNNGQCVTRYTSSTVSSTEVKIPMKGCTDDMHFYVLCNTSLGADFIPDHYSYLVSQLAKELELSSSSSISGPTANKYPMSGWETGVDIKNMLTEGKTPELTVTVRRLHSKILTPTVPESKQIPASSPEIATELQAKMQSYLTEKGSDTTVTAFKHARLQSYVVINGINKTDALFSFNSTGYMPDYYADYTSWTDWNRAKNGVEKSYINSTFDADGKYAKQPYFGSSQTTESASTQMKYFQTVNEGAKTCFVFENKPKDRADGNPAYYDRNSVISYILHVELIGSGTDAAESWSGDISLTRYYRVNIRHSDRVPYIRRNMIYQPKITGIKGFGYDTPEDAEKEEVLQKDYGIVEMELNVWNWKTDITAVGL